MGVVEAGNPGMVSVRGRVWRPRPGAGGSVGGTASLWSRAESADPSLQGAPLGPQTPPARCVGAELAAHPGRPVAALPTQPGVFPDCEVGTWRVIGTPVGLGEFLQGGAVVCGVLSPNFHLWSTCVSFSPEA